MPSSTPTWGGSVGAWRKAPDRKPRPVAWGQAISGRPRRTRCASAYTPRRVVALPVDRRTTAQASLRNAGRRGRFAERKYYAAAGSPLRDPAHYEGPGQFSKLRKNSGTSSYTVFGFRPSSYFSNRLTKRSPSISSMGGTPSRLASFWASWVKRPVVRISPFSARPDAAPEVAPSSAPCSPHRPGPGGARWPSCWSPDHGSR
jgi:hypothetical protein